MIFKTKSSQDFNPPYIMRRNCVSPSRILPNPYKTKDSNTISLCRKSNIILQNEIVHLKHNFEIFGINNPNVYKQEKIKCYKDSELQRIDAEVLFPFSGFDHTLYTDQCKFGFSHISRENQKCDNIIFSSQGLYNFDYEGCFKNELKTSNLSNLDLNITYESEEINSKHRDNIKEMNHSESSFISQCSINTIKEVNSESTTSADIKVNTKQTIKARMLVPPVNKKHLDSMRSDVNIKILLRSVKRFYSQLILGSIEDIFDALHKLILFYRSNDILHPANQIINYMIPNCKEQEKSIFEKIDEVCKQRFSRYFSNEEVKSSLSAYSLLDDDCEYKSQLSSPSVYFQIKTIIACFVVRMIMKKRFYKTKLKKIYDVYYEVITKYSHKKLRKMLNLECFRIILEEYFNSQDFEEMLNNDPTLSPKKSN